MQSTLVLVAAVCNPAATKKHLRTYLTVISISKSSTHQWRKDFLSSAPRNREPSVCTSITSRQRLAEVIARLLAWDSQLNRYKRILLLLLKSITAQKTIAL